MERRVEKGRAWLITIQACGEMNTDWRAKLPESWEDKFTYKCQCYEKGKDAKNIHTHILINFKSVRSSNRLAKELIKINPGCEIDVQQKKGRWSEAIKYVKKQDDTKISGRVPVEWGTVPRDYLTKEERREEAKELVELIKERGLEGVVEERAEMILKHPLGCKMIKELVEEESKKRTVTVTLIWGDAGTGKSTWASSEARKKHGNNVYYWTKVGGSRDTVWFNGYNGQECLIMDDISGRSLPYEYAIKITGNDPLDVEFKGGKCAARWTDVYITSNYNPIGWYERIWNENEESRRAFFRRITRIIHVYREGDEVIWDVEKDGEVRVMREDFKIIPVWKKTPSWVIEERMRTKEQEAMEKEDHNAIRKVTSIEWEDDDIERSEIGIIDTNETIDGTPDTPHKEIYWGGGDSMYLDYGPLKKGRVMAEMEKRMAFDAFVKKVNIVRKGVGAAELDRGEIEAAIKDGRLRYNEKEWMRALSFGSAILRSHDISEEEWSPESGYHDVRHEEEVDDLYELVRKWSGEMNEQSFNTQWYEKEDIEEIE